MMDNFLDMLEEFGCDNKTYSDFRDKVYQHVDFVPHLMCYDFNKKWFNELDNILTQLGYRALDKDIKFVENVVCKLLKNTYINKIIDCYNENNRINKIKLPKLPKLLDINCHILDGHKLDYVELRSKLHTKSTKVKLKKKDKTLNEALSSVKIHDAEYPETHPIDLEYSWSDTSRLDENGNEHLNVSKNSCGVFDYTFEYCLKNQDKFDWFDEGIYELSIIWRNNVFNSLNWLPKSRVIL